MCGWLLVRPLRSSSGVFRTLTNRQRCPQSRLRCFPARSIPPSKELHPKIAEVGPTLDDDVPRRSNRPSRGTPISIRATTVWSLLPPWSPTVKSDWRPRAFTSGAPSCRCETETRERSPAALSRSSKYRGSTSEIRYNAAPLVTCTLALALARFEVLLQDEAEHHFNSRVRRLEQGGTYNCRKMARFRTMVSEHSYANAIDFRSVTLADGRTIDVLSHFGKLDVEPTTEQGLFLRSVARRAYAEEVFSVVLTPFFDALHRDHFHLDMARYRVDGTR